MIFYNHIFKPSYIESSGEIAKYPCGPVNGTCSVTENTNGFIALDCSSWASSVSQLYYQVRILLTSISSFQFERNGVES